MKVLITGILGMIGSNLAVNLKQQGFAVVGIDSSDLNQDDFYWVKIRQQREKRLKEFNIKIIDLNLKNRIDINGFEDVGLIIHLAAKSNISLSVKDPSGFLTNNVSATTNVFDLARQIKANVVYASSSSVYGNSSKLKQREDGELNPLNPYAQSKVFDEQIAKMYFTNFGVKSIGARFFTVYGEMSRSDMFIFSTMKKMFTKETIILYKNGKIFRDFTFTDDIVELLKKAMNKINEKDFSFDVINFGAGQPTSVGDIVNILSNYSNIKPLIELRQEKPAADANGTSSDIEKQMSVLGKHEFIKIEDGLIRVFDWYQDLFIKSK